MGKTRRTIRSSIIFSVVATILSGSAYGQDAGAGLRIAATECAGCHAIGKEGRSPVPAAPVFREFGRRWSIDQGGVGERISMAHGDMPEFIFEPEEIADLVEYLISIQVK